MRLGSRDSKPAFTSAGRGSRTPHLDGDGPVAKGVARDRVGKAYADAAPGSLVRLSRVRTARSVADPHRCGVPRSCAADRADRRRRPRRRRGGSDPLRDRPHLERRRAVRGPRDDLRPGALRRRAPRRVRPRATPQGHGARRGGRRSPLSLARAVLLQGGGHAADVRDLSRLQRLARRVLPHRSRPAQGHRDDQPGRRPGRDQGAGARRPPRPLPAR